MGAWPVLGFCGLEIVLVYIAFKVNFRDAQRMERVRLTSQGLDIARISPGGSWSEERLDPVWMSVEIDDPPDHDSQLILRLHARRLEIGSFLQPCERLEVGQALRQALVRYKEIPRASCGRMSST
jgi:uncharacterized membrane protein